MADKHLSTQFDSELNGVSSRVMELGGLVESQIRQAIYALAQFNADAALQVMATEDRVNQMEVDIDRELSSIIARRQPTARDLRLLMAISKTTANLERVGDEAPRSRAWCVHHRQRLGAHAAASELRVAADLASGLLRKALDAFARLDTSTAVAILKEDDLIDKEFDGFVRKLITYMMEDPRTISSQPRPAVRGQGARAHRRPRQEHRRVHHLRGQGRRRAPQRRWSRSSPRCADDEEPPRVLVVEDEPAIAELVAVNLRHNGFQPIWAEDGEAAQRELDAVLPDVILLDWMLPGQSGLRWRASGAAARAPRASPS
jgi:phosphate transport system protein